jgi:hypothetical protein
MATLSYFRHEIPASTREEEAHYKALAERPDSEIDFSDIPEVTDFSGFMTWEEAKAHRAKRKQAASANLAAHR